MTIVMVMAIWDYAAVFLLALSEAMPIVGTVVPGLAPRGIVELWPLLVAAILCAAPLHVFPGVLVGALFQHDRRRCRSARRETLPTLLTGATGAHEGAEKLLPYVDIRC